MTDEKNNPANKTGKAAPATEVLQTENGEAPATKSVVLISSETMGRGDDELGATLMRTFLDTLSQFKGEVSHAIFINAGAKLTVQGSKVLEQLKQLELVGTQVLTCGTCLNYFNIKDQLAVGTVSNMYAIIETLLKADKVIRP